MHTNRYVAKGSDKNHITWIEYNGERICTMKPSENDWTYCKLIETALNTHGKLVEALKECLRDMDVMNGNVPRGSYETNGYENAKKLLQSIEQDI